MTKMNLFFLHSDPRTCAEYHCDKHVVKMVLELTQMLYTAHYIHSSKILPPDAYKPISNKKHPINIWIALNVNNYTFASTLAKCLSEEYTIRYGKVHSCDKHINWLIINKPSFENEVDYSGSKKVVVFGQHSIKGLTPFPLSMPEECYFTKNTKEYSVIKSYQYYYLIHKRKFARWTVRDIPPWFTYSDIRNYF